MFESMFVEEANAYIALDREYYGCFWNAVEYPPPPMEVADSRAAGRLGELDPAMADEAPLAYAAPILVPANAMIITSVFTLMSCLLFAGEPPYPTGSRACRAARCAHCPPDTRGFAR